MQELFLCLLGVDLLLSAVVAWQMSELRKCIPQNIHVDVALDSNESGQAIDEGFDNIMRFSVNGHTGFDAE